jgi:hypothetical protein
MGNVYASAPDNYDIMQMHRSDYLQTYKNESNNSASNNIKLGKHQLRVGAKIVSDLTTGQLYVSDKNGKKVWLSENGKMKKNSAELVKQAKNYGQGPAIRISGPITNPKYELFGATDMSEGVNYSAKQVKSAEDIRRIIELGHGGLNPDSGEFGASFGNAAVNPFVERPRDVWSGVADFNRGMDEVGRMFVVPVVEGAIETFIPGFGQISQLTGLHDILQSGLEQFIDFKAPEPAGTQVFDTALAQQIVDPRVDDYLDKMKQQTAFNRNKYPHNQEMIDSINLPENDPTMRFEKLRDLERINSKIYADESVKNLRATSNQFKEMLGNADLGDFEWSSIEAGLNTADTPEQQMRVVNMFLGKFQNELFPILQKQQQSVEDDNDYDDEQPDSVQEPTTEEPKPDESDHINGDQNDKDDKGLIHG